MTPETQLKKLREPFDEKHISKLPKPTVNRDEYKKLPKAKCDICGGYHAKTNTIHLDYVGHAALTNRLLDVDPFWTWEPMSISSTGAPELDEYGGLWIKLTICGITRIGYGHAGEKRGGDAVKEVIGDALRNAAMRFGAALDLWFKGDLHDDEPRVITSDQVDNIILLADKAGITLKVIADFCHVDVLDNIPVEMYDKVINKLNATIEHKAKISGEPGDKELFEQSIETAEHEATNE